MQSVDNQPTTPPTFTVALVEGDRIPLNGTVRPRVVLTVEDEQVVCEKVTLDSHVSIDKAAKRWAERYGIDAADAEVQLRDLGARIAIDQTERRARREAAPKLERRVSDVADDFLRSLKPTWHRKARTMYLDAAEREVAVPDLWTLATDIQVDSVTNTIEGLEAGREGDPPNYRTRLALLKDAIRMAASRVLRDLPEVIHTESDQTVDCDQLLSDLAAFLLRVRNFRQDVGEVIAESYLGWASGIEPGAGWRKCFADPVFARLDDAAAQPRIAVIGDYLAHQLRHESKRKLASDLRTASLVDTTCRVRCDTKQWRAWELARAVLDSIAKPCDAEAVSHVSA